MADCRLLQFSAFAREHDKAVRAFEYVNDDDHFLVLQEVEGSLLEVTRVFEQHVSYLLVQLPLHRLEEVPVRDRILRIRLNRRDGRP